jgi:hypothetical protein
VPAEARVGLDPTHGHGPKTAWCRSGVAAARVIDGFLPKLEEFVERSKGKIRADVAHAKIMGYSGSDRTTRRTVARLKDAWRADRRRGMEAVAGRAWDVGGV